MSTQQHIHACDLRQNLGAFTCHLASLLSVVDLVRPALRESGDTKFVSKRANMCAPLCGQVKGLRRVLLPTPNYSRVLSPGGHKRAETLRSVAMASRVVPSLVLLALAAAALALLAGSAVQRSELLMPWYEVASDGDGLGPESVNMWKVPPVASFVHPNTFQDPTKWNGDHVLNGGNKEWAEEDAALHAYNMENWRNKILQTQLHRQKQVGGGKMNHLQFSVCVIIACVCDDCAAVAPPDERLVGCVVR